MRILLWLFLSTYLQAGVVRDLLMDDSKAEAIHLCLGRSTVLRFRDKPKKIVTGNKNYFNFSFIANDVTIQPLREVSSNLFVYGEYESYAFNLKFLDGCRYDDLVKVSRPPRVQATDQVNFVLNNALKVSIAPVVKVAIGVDLWMIDLKLFNVGDKNISMDELKVKLNRKMQQWVWRNDFLNRGETTRGRIIFGNKEKWPLILSLELAKNGRRVTLPQRVK